MKTLCLTLCVFALAGAISPALMAQDAAKNPTAAMSDTEDAQLAAQAAQAPELQDFRGGDDVVLIFTPVLVVVLVLVLILILI